ncbi:MAG: zinc-dependent alcohol dehydrogenase [Flavonifractor plautii]|nr:zinc-binding dehydrogenase [Flavonifractor plautii]
MTNEEGAMAEPFAVGLHAIQVSQVKPNDRVLILGGGIIGMSCAEWARTFGASEITVSELNPQKREIIRGYQVADHVVAADAPDLEQQLLDISGGGYDLLIDCVGVPSAFNTGLRALKPEFYMRATAVGLPHAQFPLDYERLVLKRVLLRGSKGHNFDEFKTVINAMASGRISVKKYISRRIKLEEVQAGFEAMKAARGLDTKVIIETQ